MFQKVLTAYANPYAGDFRGLDPMGRAMSTVNLYRIVDQYVGATWDVEGSRAEGKRLVTFTGKPHKLVIRDMVEFSYYARQFQDGFIIPADESTAKQVNVTYEEPIAKLKACRDALVKEWHANYPDADAPACATDVIGEKPKSGEKPTADAPKTSASADPPKTSAPAKRGDG